MHRYKNYARMRATTRNVDEGSDGHEWTDYSGFATEGYHLMWDRIVEREARRGEAGRVENSSNLIKDSQRPRSRESTTTAVAGIKKL